MIKQVCRAKSLGAETGGVKPETKRVVSEAQERAKAETDIESIVKRKRAASKAKNKGEFLSHRASVTAEAEAKERSDMAKTTTRLLQRPRPSHRPRV